MSVFYSKVLGFFSTICSDMDRKSKIAASESYRSGAKRVNPCQLEARER